MPDPVFGMDTKGSKALSAVLFMGAVTITMDAFGTLNSSPWTAENVGADADKASSLRKYVGHAIVNAAVLVVISAWVAESPWPIVGWAFESIYLYAIYEHAKGEAIKTHADKMELDEENPL